MSRKKCPYCNIWIEKEEEVGKHRKYPNRSIHIDCLEKLKVEYEHEMKEKLELDDLVDTIAQIHNISKNMLPKIVYVALENLKNGRAPFETIKLTRSTKNGFSYAVIKQCYIENSDRIRKIQQSKNFNDTLGEFKYILVVMLNYLPKVKKRIENDKVSESLIQKDLEKLNSGEDFEVDVKKQQEKLRNRKPSKVTDISRFLSKDDEEDDDYDSPW